jgi:hypothetical protein
MACARICLQLSLSYFVDCISVVALAILQALPVDTTLIPNGIAVRRLARSNPLSYNVNDFMSQGSNYVEATLFNG